MCRISCIRIDHNLALFKAFLNTRFLQLSPLIKYRLMSSKDAMCKASGTQVFSLAEGGSEKGGLRYKHLYNPNHIQNTGISMSIIHNLF